MQGRSKKGKKLIEYLGRSRPAATERVPRGARPRDSRFRMRWLHQNCDPFLSSWYMHKEVICLFRSLLLQFHPGFGTKQKPLRFLQTTVNHSIWREADIDDGDGVIIYGTPLLKNLSYVQKIGQLNFEAVTRRPLNTMTMRTDREQETKKEKIVVLKIERDADTKKKKNIKIRFTFRISLFIICRLWFYFLLAVSILLCFLCFDRTDFRVTLVWHHALIQVYLFTISWIFSRIISSIHIHHIVMIAYMYIHRYTRTTHWYN